MFTNEYLKSRANIVLHTAKSIRFDRCTFTKLGGAAIDLETGSQDNVISGCRFFDLAASAVQIGDVLKDDHHPKDSHEIVKNNAVENCSIHDCGLDYNGSVGIFAGYTEGTVLAHNEIAADALQRHLGWLGAGAKKTPGTAIRITSSRSTTTRRRHPRITASNITTSITSCS